MKKNWNTPATLGGGIRFDSARVINNGNKLASALWEQSHENDLRMSQCRLQQRVPRNCHNQSLHGCLCRKRKKTTRHWIEQDKHLNESFLHNLGVEEIGNGVGFIEVNTERVNTWRLQIKIGVPHPSSCNLLI